MCTARRNAGGEPGDDRLGDLLPVVSEDLVTRADEPPEGIRGPHGHGYYPDANGRLRDVDWFNTGFGGAAGGVVSTAHDMGVFRRAFSQGKPLPPELQRVLTDRLPSDPPPGGGGPAFCDGELDGFFTGGSTAGYLAMTFYTKDGSRQLSMSATLSVKDIGGPAEGMFRAVETVFCPSAASAHPRG
ncbi:hypothetical protein [Streptosporangium saharense]|uniref:hypothetical protein n=1 Tax=Streptosporangium saharense TaxID=1706840 RepID=UPI00343AD378